MPMFRITYTDPETGDECVVERSYNDTPAGMGHGPVSARMWAEDAAYAYADKGWYLIEQI